MLLDENVFIYFLASKSFFVRAFRCTWRLYNWIWTFLTFLVPALCKCPSTGLIAFAATITQDIDNLGTNQTIVFDNVITNVGGAYDSRHGTFRAPVAGVYQFSFSVLQGSATMWLGVELVADGKVIGRVKTGDNGYYNMGSNVINTWLAADTDVWVRHMSDSDNKHVVADSGYYTLFSGHIIHADP